jgi:hypothetical protein
MEPTFLFPVELWEIIFDFCDFDTQRACGSACVVLRLFWIRLHGPYVNAAREWADRFCHPPRGYRAFQRSLDPVVPLVDRNESLFSDIRAAVQIEDETFQRRWWDVVDSALPFVAPNGFWGGWDHNRGWWCHVRRVVWHWLGWIASQPRFSSLAFRLEYLVRSSGDPHAPPRHRHAVRQILRDLERSAWLSNSGRNIDRFMRARAFIVEHNLNEYVGLWVSIEVIANRTKKEKK